MSSSSQIHEIQHNNRTHIPSLNSGTQSQMDSSVSPPEERLNNQSAGINNTETATSSGGSGGSRGKRKENPQDCRAPSQPNKSKKTLGTRSNVWPYFTRLKDNRDKCICNYCQKEFACPTKSGTSNLQKHISLCKQYKAWLESQDNDQPILGSDGVVKIAKVSEAVFRQASNELLVGAELPLVFIECAAWRQFCSKMNLYRPHSRRTAQRDIVKMYKERKATLRKWFLCNNQRVSVTTDIWKCQPTGARETHDELDTYLRDDVESYEKLHGTEFDILSWWKANSFKFPILSQIARDVFAMQVSSVAFSTSGRIITPARSCLSHFTVEVLMCTEQWVKQDIKGESKELTIAQMLAEVEEADMLEREFGSPIDIED